MTVIDRGSGTPIVMVPGIQGRWEWMGAAVDALARRCRVITFPLADEPGSGAAFEERRWADSYIDQIDHVLDNANLRRAVVCGVSYGGLIAALFAARRPERTLGVVLVSAIPPAWTPNARTRVLIRAPRLLTPLFCLLSLRLVREMAVARGGWLSGLAFGLEHLGTVMTHLFSPRVIAARVRRLVGANLEPDVVAMSSPALIITGEPGLDLVVPVESTREYLRLWPQARGVVLPRTGHLGLVTRASEFAELVARFADDASALEGGQRRHIV